MFGFCSLHHGHMHRCTRASSSMCSVAGRAPVHHNARVIITWLFSVRRRALGRRMSSHGRRDGILFLRFTDPYTRLTAAVVSEHDDPDMSYSAVRISSLYCTETVTDKNVSNFDVGFSVRFDLCSIPLVYATATTVCHGTASLVHRSKCCLCLICRLNMHLSICILPLPGALHCTVGQQN